MRHIHPIGFHEQFVASGIYQYGYKDDHSKSLDIIEHWSIHQLPDGAHLVRADWDARGEFGESRLVEILRSPETNGRHMERLDVFRYLPFANKVNRYPKLLEENYVFFDDYVQIGRRLDNHPRQQTEMRFASDMSVDPGVNADQSFVTEIVSHENRRAAVFRPGFPLTVSDTPDQIVVDCAVSILNTETITIMGHPLYARHYQVTCGADLPADYWFDDYRTLLQYEKGVMFVSLVQYARRPEPPKS